jgi:hypothetical protein
VDRPAASNHRQQVLGACHGDRVDPSRSTCTTVWRAPRRGVRAGPLDPPDKSNHTGSPSCGSRVAAIAR